MASSDTSSPLEKDIDLMMSPTNWHDTYLFQDPMIGDQESKHFKAMAAHLTYAYKRWETLEARRTFVINELYKIAELLLVAEQKFIEITEVRKNTQINDDSLYQQLKHDYEVIVAAQKKMKANFELVSNRVEHANKEYRMAKQEFDKAEMICNRIYNHSR
jgi:hypothetical protein